MVRHDDNLEWEAADRFAGTGQTDLRNSFSGHERNHLFLNAGAGRAVEVSGVSGLDHPGDGRSFVLLDLDRDGRTDIATVNANAPMLRIHRNALGERAGNVVALRLVGGNVTPAASEWSPRQPVGARVEVAVGGRTVHRTLHCGEGLGARNSDTLVVGIGDADGADSIRVSWPSGRTSVVDDVDAGALVVVHENPAETADGSGVSRDTWIRGGSELGPTVRTPTAVLDAPAAAQAHLDGAAPDLVLYTTMATWCTACRGELPQARRLRSLLGEDRMAFFGVPVDPDDSLDKLDDYVAEAQPAYRMLTGLTPEETGAVREILQDALGVDALPGTVITDRDGRVLAAVAGLPSASQLLRLADSIGD